MWLLFISIKKIKKITSEQPREIKKETPHSSLEEETESIFEDEIDYYLSPLNALERNVTESKINQLLPSSKKHNYKKILFRLKLEFQKNIYEIKDFIETELDNLDNEDLTFFKQELLQEELKINEDDLDTDIQIVIQAASRLLWRWRKYRLATR